MNASTLYTAHRLPARWLPDQRHAVLMTAMVWTLLVLLIVPDRFDFAGLSDPTPAPASPLNRALWLGLLSVSGIVLIWRLSLSWLLLRHLNLFLPAFLLLAALSIGWSLEPDITLRRVIRATTVVMVAAAFVLVGWQRQRLQNVLRPIITLLLGGSLLFGLLAPELAIHQEINGGIQGCWRGLTHHKNTLGLLAGLGVILWAHAGLTGERRASRCLAGMAISLACLLLAQSSTALVTTTFCVLFLFLLLRSPQPMRPYLPLLVGLLALAIITYSLAVLRLVPGLEFLLEPIANITGKDLTFTGRSAIWDIMLEHVELYPWLGSGYGAFWIGPVESSPSYQFVRELYFYPGSAHNGYLEVVSDLGAIGLLCLIGYLAVLVIQGLRLLVADREQVSLIFALLLHQAITNFSESHWFHSLAPGFTIMTLATLALARQRLQQQLLHVFGAQPVMSRRFTPGLVRP